MNYSGDTLVKYCTFSRTGANDLQVTLTAYIANNNETFPKNVFAILFSLYPLFRRGFPGILLKSEYVSSYS